MQFLFLHRHFPGQFLHLLRHLVAQGGHRIVFVSEPNDNQMAGVHRATYGFNPTSLRTHFDSRDFDAAMRRAAAVEEVCRGVKATGFEPDIIIGHEGWGEMMNVGEIWPNTPRVGYREYFYHLHGADVGCDPEFPVPPGLIARIRAKNASILLALHNGYPGIAPTQWQRSLYPAWAQAGITVVPEGVDLSVCRPDPGQRDGAFRLGDVTIPADARLVTFVARDLEPYRGFHTLMRALPAIMARPDTHVACLGGSGSVYGAPPAGGGSWLAAMMREVGERLDRARLHFPGVVPYHDHIRLLQRSDLHTYLSYPFIASWSLREALACGCAIVAADTSAVAEFLTQGDNAALVPLLDHRAVATRVLDLLADDAARQRLAAGARRFAERALRMEDHIAAYEALIRVAVFT